MFIFRKNNSLFKIINNSLIDLPIPANLSINWNYGSLMGLVLIIQIITGVLLATRYRAHSTLAFDSIIFLVQDSRNGWLFRLLHSTGATFFFILIYLHIGRGLYYGSYIMREVWFIGVLLLFLLVITAFLGYVLPWGQMSYWGATVITNFVRALPYVGKSMTEWIWGGYSVGGPTLTRFFAIHYLMPFIMLFLTILHLFYLHMTGRSNPLGIASNTYKVPFHIYYVIKDLLILLTFSFIFLFTTLNYGYNLIDAENFIPANPLVTPIHIQPEWYFLFTYAILRSIPNKLGGVVLIASAFLVLFLFGINRKNHFFRGFQFSPISRFIFWSLVSVFLLLTWLGSCPAESPFVEVSLACTLLYFFLFGLLLFIANMHYWFFRK